METHLQITGITCLLLACMHVVLPKRFNWRNELVHLGLFNRQVFKVHTFFIALTVFLMGLLLTTSASQLVSTNLGIKVLLGLSVFWFLRLIVQLFIYSPKLWRGKPFETTVHILFTGMWVYFVLTLLYPVFMFK